MSKIEDRLRAARQLVSPFIWVIQDITMCSGAQDPKILPIPFDSQKAALLYIKHFGSAGCEARPIGPAVSLNGVEALVFAKQITDSKKARSA